MELNLQTQKKKIIWGTNLFLIISFFVIFILPSAMAVNSDNALVVAMADTVLQGPMKIITGVIAPSAGSSGVLIDLWAACTGTMPAWLQSVFNYMKGLGALLAIAITMAHIFENVQREQNPVEAIWKSLIELFATFLILMNIGTILDKSGGFITAIISNISTTGLASSTVSAEDLLKALTGHTSGNFFWMVQAWISLAIPWILSQLIIIAAKFVVIQICLEIIIRKTFTPLAVADIYREGLRSPGMRYMKRYLGAYLKMAVCAVIALAIGQLAGSTASAISDASDGLEFCFSTIALNFSSIAVMLKAGEYTNDIMGA